MVAVGIVSSEGGEPDALVHWHAEISGRIRRLPRRFSSSPEREGIRSVVISDRIIGCPHEKDVDYPEGEVCPMRPSGPTATDGQVTCWH